MSFLYNVLDYTLGWDLLIWDLKGRVCFGILIKIFVAVYQNTLSSSCICSVLSHTAPAADILLFIHFYVSLCEILLTHTPCLYHNYIYLTLLFCFYFYLGIQLFNYHCNCICNLFKYIYLKVVTVLLCFLKRIYQFSIWKSFQ